MKNMMLRTMKRKILMFMIVVSIPSLAIAGSISYLTQARDENDILPDQPIPEGNDYATQVLGDPWDMNEFSDISQYLNQSGEVDIVQNISVADGVFSATAAGDVSQGRNGWFFTLFPGYKTAIHTGRTGSKMPISSSQYQCLYIAMKVDSPAAGNFGPDQYLVYWFADDNLNAGTYGFTAGIALYPEYGANQPRPVWKLYKIDLAATISYETSWTRNSEWQGLRIDPTIYPGVNYAIDWVRLTDCSPYYVTVAFTPDANISAMWLRPEDTSRYIRVATDVNGASGYYDLDVQGIQPGRYYISFGDHFSHWTSENNTSLFINQSPLVTFNHPTFYTGDDFAVQVGNPWDMASSDDYNGIRCAEFGQGDGVLWLQTPPNDLQPPECRGTVNDPYIYLNLPTTINPAEYRYLSFRLYDANPWQYVPKGSIVRWVWTVQGDSGRPGYECHLVSQDMPFDVGWHTYSIDLWTAFDGSAEEWQGECSTLPKNWYDSSPILRVRFDPNENITDHYFYNEIDWIRLTREISVHQGEPFSFLFEINKPTEDVVFDFYYTTDPKNEPMQNPMVLYSSPLVDPLPDAEYQVFLPIVFNKFLGFSGEQYTWDTSGVTPDVYYLCIVADDGYNQSIRCSDAFVRVLP